MRSGFRRSLVRLTLFTVVTVLLTAFLARTIEGFQGEHTTTYSAVFSNATRLKPGDDVRLAGVSVGRVRSVSLTRSAQADVQISVDTSVEMTTATTAAIRYRNLIGDRYVALTVPLTGTRLAPGATLPESHTSPALDLTAVFNGFKPLFQGLDASSINALSLSLVQALQGEGGTIASLLDGTGSLGHAIARHDATIDVLVRDLTSVITTLNERSRPLDELISHLRDLTGGLARGRTQIVDALAGIDRLAGATSTLLSRSRPYLAGTIRGLRATAHRLATHRGVLQQKLNLLPVKLNAIMRSAQYGSWFQFYNCGIGLQVDLGSSTRPITIPPYGPSTGICGA
ncbi:MAG: MCE family protein [Nocardioidaceae bacterium]|nr:MCE family protein [Nocardioidaceae bacterium]MCL2612445.1 MCE family protein [Nocardioidaceae bacterium]